MNHTYFAERSASWPPDLVLQIAIEFMQRHKDDKANDGGLTKRLETYIEADDDA